MIESKYYEITIKSPEEEELKLKVHWDSSINDWIDKFKVILKWLTFHDDTIKEVFPEEE